MTERHLDVAIPDGVDFALEDLAGNPIDTATFAAGDVKISKAGAAVVDAANLPSFVTGSRGKYSLALDSNLDFKDPPTTGPFVTRLAIEINHSTGPSFRDQSIVVRLGGASGTSFRETP